MPISYRARFLLPVSTGPVPNGTITLDTDEIVDVGNQAAVDHDLGNVAIIPQLINTHTHLEFSGRRQPFGRRGIPFCQWIETLVEARRGAEVSNADLQAAYRQGAEEIQQSGVAAVGDIQTPSIAQLDLPKSRIRTTRFLELIGLSRDRVADAVDLAMDFVAGDSTAEPHGLSPHAPYTVHPQLLEDLCRISSDSRCPLAMHLAESPEELELISSGSGPFVETLGRLGAWDPTAIPRGVSPLYYLEMLAKSHRALVIHGTFLATDEVEFVAKHPNMSIVYCPRTHDFFPHGRYPLAELLAAGVRVALGTDSRASNPDLSLLKEMQFVARTHADVSAADILRMGTLSGAESMGCDSSLGSLEAGKSPRCLVVSLPEDVDDPLRALFDQQSRLTQVLNGLDRTELATPGR